MTPREQWLLFWSYWRAGNQRSIKSQPQFKPAAIYAESRFDNYKYRRPGRILQMQANRRQFGYAYALSIASYNCRCTMVPIIIDEQNKPLN